MLSTDSEYAETERSNLQVGVDIMKTVVDNYKKVKSGESQIL